MIDNVASTIMQFGILDASDGQPFAPEMYTVNHEHAVAYTDGFLFVQPDNVAAKRFILAGVDGESSRNRNPWQFPECGEDDGSEEIPGVDQCVSFV